MGEAFLGVWLEDEMREKCVVGCGTLMATEMPRCLGLMWPRDGG